MVVALLGAIAGINLGMVASHVSAYDPGRGDCGQRGYSWEYCGYQQKAPQISQMDEYSCHWWSDGFHHCGPGGYAYKGQPAVTQVFFRDNCFWSFPVKCSPESSVGSLLPLYPSV